MFKVVLDKLHSILINLYFMYILNEFRKWSKKSLNFKKRINALVDRGVARGGALDQMLDLKNKNLIIKMLIC